MENSDLNAAAHRSIRILLVEDVEHDRIAFRRAFRNSSMNVEITERKTGIDALTALKEGHKFFDIVVSDYKMPGINGMEFYQEILRRKYNLPLVLMTGYGTENLAIKAFKSGVDDYLVKDTAQGYLKLLPVLISEVLDRHSEKSACRKAETELEKHRKHLEEMVSARTRELQELNEKLKREISERKYAQEQLNIHRDSLKELVKERTGELKKTNRTLRLEIKERRKTLEELDKRYEFEKLVARISSSFVNVPPEKLEETVTSSLKSILRFTGDDRAYIFLFSQEATFIVKTYEYSARKEAGYGSLNGAKNADYLWITNKLKALEIVHVPNLKGLPPEAGNERTLWNSMGIVSMLVIPILHSGVLAGCMGLNVESAKRTGKTWRDEDISLLKIAGELVLNTVKYKHSELLIMKAHQQLRSIIDTIPGAVNVIDLEHNIIDVNLNMLKYFGVKNRNDVIGRKCYTAYKCSQTPCSLCPLANVLKTGEPSSRMTTMEEEEMLGGKTFKIYMSPVKDENGEIWAVVECMVDVSDLRRVQKALKKAKDAADNTTRMKTEFLARITHELKTPMNAIMGFAGILLDSDLTEEQRKSLSIIKSCSVNMLALINDLLDISRIEAGRVRFLPARVSLGKSMEELVSSMKPHADFKKLDLSLDISPDIPDKLILDPLRLNQILVNLTGNAIKFTEKGDVRVRVRPLAPETFSEMSSGSKADLSLSTSEITTLHFSVRDTGIGIPVSMQSSLFDAASQIRRPNSNFPEGSGLGLVICKQLVNLMCGEIWFRSDKGKGSTFNFTLPLLHDRKPSAKKPELHVLLAGNEPVSQYMLQSALALYGHLSHTVGSPQEITRFIGTGTYDMLIIEINSQKIDWIEAIRKIRAKMLEAGKSVPLIALMPFIPTAEKNFIDAGATACLFKPFTLKAFDEVLKKFSAQA